MKFKWIALLLVVLLATQVFAQKKKATDTKKEATPAKKTELTTEKDKISYIIGLNIGTSMKKDEVDVDVDIFTKGLNDALSGANPLMTQDEMAATWGEFQKKFQDKQAKVQKDVSEKNKKEGEDFLAANKKKDSIITTKSGLQYKILKVGTGKTPKATDTVVTHYRGYLIDGTEFDNSYQRNQPATFAVGGVIPGWVEALQMMPVGSKWQLFIPSNLGYGERGAGQVIAPNATLIFEIELLEIK
jgi:FKBP-type peptidyl-prolyl cis-trans isomerase FklB